MAEIQVVQRSKEWYEMRFGRVTSTTIRGVMEGSPKKLNAILRDIREPDPKEFDAPALRWGRHYEKEAQAYYVLSAEFIPGWNLRDSGFWVHDEVRCVGGSPDGIWEDDFGRVIGGVEIKCPYNPEVHLRYLEYGLPPEHQWQVFFLMWLTDADFWDFVSYDPRSVKVPFMRQRIFRDKHRVHEMEVRLKEFTERLINGEWYEEIPRAQDILNSGMLEYFLTKKGNNG